jgi:hypothetical protein
MRMPGFNAEISLAGRVNHYRTGMVLFSSGLGNEITPQQTVAGFYRCCWDYSRACWYRYSACCATGSPYLCQTAITICGCRCCG